MKVDLVDSLGSDLTVVNAARVSLINIEIPGKIMMKTLLNILQNMGTGLLSGTHKCN